MEHIHTPKTRHVRPDSPAFNPRVLYKKCGQEGKNATFILTEAEMKDETFLEIMNSFLMTGEVPNLFPKVLCLCPPYA